MDRYFWYESPRTFNVCRTDVDYVLLELAGVTPIRNLARHARAKCNAVPLRWVPLSHHSSTIYTMSGNYGEPDWATPGNTTTATEQNAATGGSIGASAAAGSGKGRCVASIGSEPCCFPMPPPLGDKDSYLTSNFVLGTEFRMIR